MPPSKSWDHERRCLYCTVSFRPKRPQDARQRFCCPNHRKDYNYHGASFVQRVREDLAVEFIPVIDELRSRIEALEKRLDTESGKVVTLARTEEVNERTV